MILESKPIALAQELASGFFYFPHAGTIKSILLTATGKKVKEEGRTQGNILKKNSVNKKRRKFPKKNGDCALLRIGSRFFKKRNILEMEQAPSPSDIG